MLRAAIGASIVLVALLSLAVPSSAGPCFRGKTLPDCTSFLIVENSYARRLGEGMHYAFGEFGYMQNRSQRWAIGGTVMFGVRGSGSSELRGGAAVRVRRWLSSGNAVDLSSGPLLASADGLTRLGGAAGLTYNIADRVHITSRWEYVKMPGKDESSIYIGAGLGSKPALIGGALVGILVGGAALVWED